MSPQEHMNEYKSSVPPFVFYLYSTNYNLSYVYFFSILNFAYFIRKVKQIYCKLQLVKHRIEHKNLWCTNAAKWASHPCLMWRHSSDAPIHPFFFFSIHTNSRRFSFDSSRNWTKPAKIYWNQPKSSKIMAEIHEKKKKRTCGLYSNLWISSFSYYFLLLLNWYIFTIIWNSMLSNI